MWVLLVVAGVAALFMALLHGHNVAVLSPAGEIANKQRNLLVFGTLLSLFVVIPVFVMTTFIVVKYRASNNKARYAPEWGSNKAAEIVWWTLPLILITILSVVTWRSSYALDPYRPLSSSKQPINIQVVALDWKWLFIFPDQHIASVNYLEFPVSTPVNFEITADAPMNSFWIPKLGGQVYAMPGMSTQLHLIANRTGDFNGSSANLSGRGFAGMKFTAHAGTENDFNAWIKTAQQSKKQLTKNEYENLATPSEDNPIMLYSSVDGSLYDTITMKYMGQGNMTGMNN